MSNKSRAAMVKYLTEHFRYDTMNSWNQSTSYARKVKIHSLSFSSAAAKHRAYELLDCPEAFDGINAIIRAWDREHNFQWQAGFNGRSGGYIVLYSGGLNPDGGAFSYPGKSIDQGEDFSEWDIDSIRERYALVKSFDKMVDSCIAAFIRLAEHGRVEEKTVYIPKKIKVLAA